jgi:hypothetical protein
MLKINWTLSAALLAVSCAVTAPQARAQQAYHGAFTLPVAAHFGSVVLQPGEYSISTLERTRAIRVTGDGGTATILASSIDTEAAFGKGRITLENVNGAFALKRFDSGALGRRFDFVIAKTVGKDRERGNVAQGNVLEIATK